jgi:hypothetical protein
MSLSTDWWHMSFKFGGGGTDGAVKAKRARTTGHDVYQRSNQVAERHWYNTEKDSEKR